MAVWVIRELSSQNSLDALRPLSECIASHSYCKSGSRRRRPTPCTRCPNRPSVGVGSLIAKKVQGSEKHSSLINTASTRPWTQPWVLPCLKEVPNTCKLALARPAIGISYISLSRWSLKRFAVSFSRLLCCSSVLCCGLVGHRGIRGRLPENSMQSFKEAIRQGVRSDNAPGR